MTDNRKFAANITIFFVFLALETLGVVMRAVRLTDNQIDVVYTLISQILCMGVLPVLLFKFFYKKDGLSARKTAEAGNAFSSFVMRLTGGGFAEHTSLVLPKKRTVSKVFLVAFFMLFINIVLASWNYIIIQLLGFKPTNGAGTLYPNMGRVFLDLILVAALPAVFEELTFRGILLGAYKDSPKFGIFISSLLFALMHMNIQQFFYTFVGGLVFGYVVVKSRSIISSMIVHFCLNAFAVFRSYGYQHPESVSSLMNDVLGALPVFALYAFAAGMAYFMLKTIRTLDEGDPVDMNAPLKRGPLKNYAFMAGAIVFGGLTTIFTLVWGVVR
jgi:membrane protease YdiL (CAAX protease family)